jgi:hypothetical protein
MNYDEIKKHFDENGYVVIKNFLKKDTANLLYEYSKLKSRRALLKEAFDTKLFDKKYDGQFEDEQAPGAYSLYGDPLMDALLQNSNSFVSSVIGKKLIPTYSYWRLYITNNVLKKHKDRPSCEYSTTLCLGYDVSNIEDTNYNWPIYIKSYNNEEKCVILNQGDMVIYKGCDVEHWRDAYKGLNHSQVFLHYNEENGKYNIKYDGREFLGLPAIKR